MQFIFNLVHGQALMRVKGYVFTVDDGITRASTVSRTFDIQQVALFCCCFDGLHRNFPLLAPIPPGTFCLLLSHTPSVKPPTSTLLSDNSAPLFTVRTDNESSNTVFRGPARLTCFYHVINILFGETAYIVNIMHHSITLQISLNFKAFAQDRANDHAICLPPSARLGLRNVPVAFLCQVRQVDSKTIHVATVPFVLLSAIFARIVAQACAQALSAGHGAIICRLHV